MSSEILIDSLLVGLRDDQPSDQGNALLQQLDVRLWQLLHLLLLSHFVLQPLDRLGSLVLRLRDVSALAVLGTERV